VRHAPWPSQAELGVNIVVPTAQVEPLQAVPGAYF